MSALDFFIPVRAPSTPNLREHWSVKAKRTKAQRGTAMLKCPHWQGGAFLVVTLTRHGLRLLDSDNLAAALKGYRDGVAARLRVDDGSPLVEWQYAQKVVQKGSEGVSVTFSEAVRGAGKGAA